jgi:hypothetical protein
MSRRRLAPSALAFPSRRAARSLPPRRAHGQRRRVNRSPLLRLALSVLLAVVALAAAGNLLAFH